MNYKMGDTYPLPPKKYMSWASGLNKPFKGEFTIY